MKRASNPFDADDAIWKLTPLIDFPSPRPFTYDFRWEREWRVADDVRFKEEEVAFLFIPEHNHAAAWTFFDDARNDNTGPGYFCPYIDPTWNVEKVREALDKAKTRLPPAISAAHYLVVVVIVVPLSVSRNEGQPISLV